MAATEHVILVDEKDRPVGTAEKIAAHRNGLCHRAFSVFVFRKRQTLQVLLQQRAKEKYHSPNLWTNTCCSHPRPGEDLIVAANRRLKEEFGLTVDLIKKGQFHYVAHFNNGLIENEVDHVLIGFVDDHPIKADPAEIQAFRWLSLDDLRQEMASKPTQFTPWFEKALKIATQDIDGFAKDN